MSGTASNIIKLYNYEQVRALVDSPVPDIVLVDVREPAEFAKVQIPTSINVPYRSFPRGLALEASVFEATFETVKPSLDKEIIIFCASGGRASEAQRVAVEAGYKLASLYPGSINEWVARERAKF